jgi:hypothetical protein
MSTLYETLISPFSGQLAETPKSYSFLTERHIQAIWLEQKYFRNLKTSSGKSIEVISPGIWNAGAGPDFLKASLLIDGKPVKGDIEIHLVEQDWLTHQHHLDERYENVVLHVTYWLSKKSTPISTKSGRTIDNAYLEPIMTIPLSRVHQLIDLELYPYQKFVGSGKCAQTLFKKLSEDNIRQLFRHASGWRLNQKRRFLETKTEDPELYLEVGIASALGYKNNTSQFLDLFLWLRQLPLQNEEEVFALSLDACGFFNPPYCQRWESSSFYHRLKTFAEQSKQRSKCVFSLHTHQIRPLNHPIRRLAYLAKLIHDPQARLIKKIMMHTWERLWQENNPWKKLKMQLLNLIPTYQDSYWNNHYTFTSQQSDTFLPLIGDDLKTQLLINTFLPLLQKEIEQRGDPLEIKALQTFFSTFSSGGSSKTKYLIHRFFGDTSKGELLNKAEIEQGAIQLHRDYCMHFEASCEGCPFVERYSSLYHLR